MNDINKAVDMDQMMDLICQKVDLYNPSADMDHLMEAYRFARDAHDGQLRKSGEPYFTHALIVADVLSDLKLDTDTLIAALMHDVVEDTPIELQEIQSRYGDDVALMVDGVTKISDIKSHNPETRKAENYRKLVLSIAKDPRTVLIKLADRLHNMRTVQYLAPERQISMATETMDVYAPLAHRFGLSKIKWELEDMCFKVLHPEQYFEVVENVSQKRADREKHIEEIRGPLLEALQSAGIEVEIEGRPKHFWSIYNKMKNQQVSIDKIYDLLALRILVNTKVDCYHALGIVHSLFTPLPDRIKDFVASPKVNMYQSLHTTIKTPSGRNIEIQIRTHKMHERSEIGIASHWRYKEGDKSDSIDFGNMVNWLRQLMEWQEDVADPREFMETMKIDLFQDDVFVFSPRGDIFELPKGSTPLDFAFEVHSEVGMKCVGAKVNGRIISLGTELRNRDTVEILTSNNSSPSTSWLGLVKTSRAKHHVRRWIRLTQMDQSVKLGHEILDKESKKEKIKLGPDTELLDVAQELGYTEVDKMFAAVGRGDLTAQRVLNRFQPPEKKKREKLADLGKDIYATVMRRKVKGVRVQGMDSMMIRYARCCQPVPGDQITGIITRGRGVSVHRVGCQNLEGPTIDENRFIEVNWDVSEDQTFMVKIIVTAEDRKGLLADVTNAISQKGSNIHGGDFVSSKDGTAKVTFLVEVRNLNNLDKLIKAVKKVSSVDKVDRFQLT
jgi:GTP diphosphokinase / guanosine-3',5'-bis(diphosphate) 3'-diphosphatase